MEKVRLEQRFKEGSYLGRSLGKEHFRLKE